VFVTLAAATQQSGEDQTAIDTAKKLTNAIKNCPRRDVVAQFSKKWSKQAWGPPASVAFDVEKTSSIVHPYQVVVEFSLVWSYGPERKTKEDADKDTDLRPMLNGRYRNIYGLGHHSLVLAKTEVKDAVKGTWGDRPRWADACWDSVPKTSLSENR
jgi:hypothetical protein